MSDKAAEPQSIAHWPALKQAIQRIVVARDLVGDTLARQMLVDGLRSGMLTAYVSRWAVKDVGEEPSQHTNPIKIYAGRWGGIPSQVLNTGNHHFESSDAGRYREVWWFDIRVQPEGLNENFPIAKPPAPPPPPPTPADDDNEPDSTKPPVVPPVGTNPGDRPTPDA